MMRGFGPKKPNKQQRRAKRAQVPFLRLKANIQVISTKMTAKARVFLNDLSITGAGCFVDTPIDKGEKIAVVIEQPKHIYLRAEVMWCAPYTLDTKVLTTEQYKYRVGLKFDFDSPDEQEAVKQYIETLASSSGGKIG